MQHIVKILRTEFVTHDVKNFILSKPESYSYTPGQATETAIYLPNWIEDKHPFTFTSLNQDKVLQFIIKKYRLDKYPNHSGMTEVLHTLEPGHELIIGEPFGTIEYQCPGIFIAGGAGITPFIAIFRDLANKKELAGNKLLFSNKRAKDIIIEKELTAMFQPDDLILTLTREKNDAYYARRIDKQFLKDQIDNFDQNFYLCGPPKFVKDIKNSLDELGAKPQQLVFEK